MNWKRGIILLTILCLIATALGIYLLGGINPEQLQITLEQMGIWAPLIYILLYTIATLLILPSTPLNLTGGAIFGAVWGTVWTSVAAVIAAIVGFAFTRTIGRNYIAHKLAGRWEAMDAEIRQGGLFYLFAVRLLPIIPYGIVNFGAGLTSIRVRDYIIGTFLGTVPGILPFVLMGSGLQAVRSGNVAPLMLALALMGLLVGGATWYRRRRRFPREAVENVRSQSGVARSQSGATRSQSGAARSQSLND